MPPTDVDISQVGILSLQATPHERDEHGEFTGVGDDKFSWSYDGYRKCKFHGSCARLPYSNSQYKPGDVVGKFSFTNSRFLISISTIQKKKDVVLI